MNTKFKTFSLKKKQVLIFIFQILCLWDRTQSSTKQSVQVASHKTLEKQQISSNQMSIMSECIMDNQVIMYDCKY